MSLPPGQAGIRFREALLAQDLGGMRRWHALLDEAHVIELILGGALRDGRDGFGAARAFARGEDVLERLLGEPDTGADEAASAWIAAGRVPDRWRPEGRAARPEVDVVDAYAGGAGGLGLVDRFVDHPLHAPVSLYYRRGTIHALGPRPLLILAAVSTSPGLV